MTCDVEPGANAAWLRPPTQSSAGRYTVSQRRSIAHKENLQHAAACAVMSKSFDNGVICCSEHNLVVVQSCAQAFRAALEQHGAAVLSEQETAAFLNVMVDPVSNRFKPHANGQLAADLAAQAGIPRPYPIKLLVIPTGEVHQNNPLALEKLAPILSLFTVADERAGIQVCQELLAIDGLGHTAIIYTDNAPLIESFTARMPASRILVNAPGAQAGIGMTSGLIPSLTLGCGTFGGTSTTDNVTRKGFSPPQAAVVSTQAVRRPWL